MNNLKYTSLSSLFLILACFVQAQTFTHVDMSSFFNYDAVGTQSEINYAATQADGLNPYRLSNILGNHSINNNTAYTIESSAGSGDALPLDGVLGAGKYQISTGFDDPTALPPYSVKSDNMLHIQANNTITTASSTLTLAPGQQGQYDAVNFVFVSNRAADSSGYSSQISVTYTDASSELILLTTRANSGRGTFGSANFGLTTDAYTFTNEAPGAGETVSLSNVIASTNFLGGTGSGASARSLIRSGTASLWEFSQDIALDPSKTLESITFQLTRGGVNRNNDLWVAGTTLVVIPEPSSLLLMGVAALGLLPLLRRRR